MVGLAQHEAPMMSATQERRHNLYCRREQLRHLITRMENELYDMHAFLRSDDSPFSEDVRDVVWDRLSDEIADAQHQLRALDAVYDKLP